MTILIKRFIIFLIAALPFAVFAQSNYYPGYVLKNSGDTLKGYIDYHEWTQSPKTIDFKVNKNDKNTQKFDPQTIKGFQINGLDTYTSYAGFITTGTTDFPNLRQGLDTGKTAEAIFLRQLVTGNHLTLFYQSDNSKIRFFIAETGSEPVELKYYEYLNEYNQVVNSSVYRGQLILYVNKFRPGNDKLNREIEQIKYTQDDLQNIVNDINDHKINIQKKSMSRFFVGVALNNTTTAIDNANGVNGQQTAASISPKISAGVDVFGNPTIQQFILRVELSFFYVSPRVKYAGVSGYGSQDVYTFNQYTGTITPQLLFNVYNKDKVKIYIDAGIAFNFSAYSDNQFTFHGLVIKNPYVLEDYWADFPFQAGVVLNKKLEFCVTYTGYAAFTRYTGFSAASQITGLGVKFLFGK